jgi:hypothetical protein
LRQSGTADWLDNDSVGTRLALGLHEFQNLLALLDAVAVSVENFYVDPKAPGSVLCRRSLFDLVIVFSCDERDYNAESLHCGRIIRQNWFQYAVRG